MAQTWIYYEKHDGSHTKIPGWSTQKMTLNTEVTDYIKVPDTEQLTTVEGFTWDGFAQADEKGDISSNPRGHLMVTHHLDAAWRTLLEAFFRTATLNVGLVVQSAGTHQRWPEQDTGSDVRHMLTYLYAGCRVINLDMSRGGGTPADVVNVSFNYQAFRWVDHDKEGTQCETTWVCPIAMNRKFDEDWNDKSSGKWKDK
jgi:hypothetical protein